MIFQAPSDTQGLIQKPYMIEGILKIFILPIDECAIRITVLSFFVLFICIHIFGRTLAKVDILEFDTSSFDNNIIYRVRWTQFKRH